MQQTLSDLAVLHKFGQFGRTHHVAPNLHHPGRAADAQPDRLAPLCPTPAVPVGQRRMDIHHIHARLSVLLHAPVHVQREFLCVGPNHGAHIGGQNSVVKRL